MLSRQHSDPVRLKTAWAQLLSHCHVKLAPIRHLVWQELYCFSAKTSSSWASVNWHRTFSTAFSLKIIGRVNCEVWTARRGGFMVDLTERCWPYNPCYEISWGPLRWLSWWTEFTPQNPLPSVHWPHMYLLSTTTTHTLTMNKIPLKNYAKIQGNSSVCNMLALLVWGPSFNPQIPNKKARYGGTRLSSQAWGGREQRVPGAGWLGSFAYW